MDDIADGCLGTGRQRRKVTFRNAIGALGGIRTIEARPANVRRDQAANGPFKSGQCFARLRKLALDRDIGDRDVLVIDAAILRKPGIVAFKICLGFERQVPRHAGELLVPARIGREVDGALAELIAFDRRHQRPP